MDLDLYSAPTVREALSDHGRVVVDCSRLSFIDCTGLSALLAAARTAKAKGTELRLCAISRALARLLRLSHTAGAFTIEPEPTSRTPHRP
ncbi:STAS domain-containing protein [Streptomyces sp. NPDC005507]|uniref:STAS domain-containing protein n=1 Tax=Streptomyces sp. NPDC005507 TaxID=3154885 RepID=UPI0033BBC1F5